jgi:hypothetical protein
LTILTPQIHPVFSTPIITSPNKNTVESFEKMVITPSTSPQKEKVTLRKPPPPPRALALGVMGTFAAATVYTLSKSGLFRHTKSIGQLDIPTNILYVKDSDAVSHLIEPTASTALRWYQNAAAWALPMGGAIGFKLLKDFKNTTLELAGRTNLLNKTEAARAFLERVSEVLAGHLGRPATGAALQANADIIRMYTDFQRNYPNG